MKSRNLDLVKRWVKRGRSAFRSQVIILLYHRIFEPFSDPQRLCVSPERFNEHLGYLKRRFFVMTLSQLKVAIDERNLPKRAVVVTFDDGYADNLYNAKPLLERYDVPAMVSVTTGYVGQAKEFWWDELERLVLLSPEAPEQVKVTINGKTWSWELNDASTSDYRQWHIEHPDTPTPRHTAYRELHRLLRPLRYEEQEGALAAMREQFGDSGKCRADYDPLNSNEVQWLAEGGLIEVGSHTVTHPVLSLQPLEVQQYELAESKRQLEALMGHPVTTLVYPYGGSADVGSETPSLARNTGYTIGCTQMPETVTLRSDIFQLPRFPVRDWDGEEFACRLEKWFHG